MLLRERILANYTQTSFQLSPTIRVSPGLPGHACLSSDLRGAGSSAAAAPSPPSFALAIGLASTALLWYDCHPSQPKETAAADEANARRPLPLAGMRRVMFARTSSERTPFLMAFISRDFLRQLFAFACRTHSFPFIPGRRKAPGACRCGHRRTWIECR